MRALPLIVLFGITCQAAVAQVSVGHRAGVSFSRWLVNGGEGTIAKAWNDRQKLVPGLSVELPVEFAIRQHLMLGSGLAFIQKGYQYKGSSKQQYRSNYLQVPLTVGWAFDRHRFRVTPSIGGAFGMNVRGTGVWRFEDRSNSSWTFPIGRMDDKGYAYRKPDQEWSMLARLGIAYTWDHSALTLDLSYQYGLSNAMFDFQFTDINGNPVDPGNIPIPEARQRSYVVQLGYVLSLGSGGRKPKPVEALSDSTRSILAEAGIIPKVMVGTRFGATRSTMSFSASLPEEEARVVDGAEPLMGITAAVMVKVRLSDHWSLRSELAYMQKGWRCQWYPRPTLENDLLRMTYLELPLLVSYQMTGHKLRPFVLAGPVIGRGLGGVQLYHAVGGTAYGDFYNASAVTFGDKPGDHNPWDFSAQAGVGLAFAVGHSELNLDMRYQHGFSDVVSDPSINLYSEKAQASHRNWMLNIGYLVPWRK